MSVDELEAAFDAGEDMSKYFDFSKARRPGLEPKRVNVDFPSWMVDAMDRHASILGVTRQSLIKVWIADRLEQREKAVYGPQTVRARAEEPVAP